MIEATIFYAGTNNNLRYSVGRTELDFTPEPKNLRQYAVALIEKRAAFGTASPGRYLVVFRGERPCSISTLVEVDVTELPPQPRFAVKLANR